MSIRRHKQEVDRVGRDTACGILLEGYGDFQPGDVLKCYSTELIAPPPESVVSQAFVGKYGASLAGNPP